MKDGEFTNENINLVSLITNDNRAATIKFLTHNQNIAGQNDIKTRFNAGAQLGSQKASDDSTVIGTVGEIIGGIPGFIWSPIDSTWGAHKEKKAYQALLAVQGRYEEAGFIDAYGRTKEGMAMWVGLPLGELLVAGIGAAAKSIPKIIGKGAAAAADSPSKVVFPDQMTIIDKGIEYAFNTKTGLYDTPVVKTGNSTGAVTTGGGKTTSVGVSTEVLIKGTETNVAPKVVATVTVDGTVFVDVNQTAKVGATSEPTLIADRVAKKIEKEGKEYPNGTVADSHAEIGAIQQAFSAGKTRGADMSMTVSGKDVCGYCVGDIAAAAQKAGLKSLTVYATDNVTGLPKIYYWLPGMKSIMEKK